MKDTNGTVFTTSEEQKTLSKVQFQELLNKPAPEPTTDIIRAEEDLPINILHSACITEIALHVTLSNQSNSNR